MSVQMVEGEKENGQRNAQDKRTLKNHLEEEEDTKKI
jgi:hypothetical protein